MREKDASVTETTGSSTPTSRSKRLQSAQNSGMECSIFRFNNVNFVVGNSKDKEKLVLQDVSGTVKWGHVLAVMGSSGAGTCVNVMFG